MSSKLLRVTQLDAVQLDNEIYRILKSTFDNAIHHLPVSKLILKYNFLSIVYNFI